MGEAGSKEGEEVCVSDGVGWVELVRVKSRRRMGVGQKEKPSQLLKRIKLAGSCKDAGADVPLPVVVPARACRTNAGLFAACLVRQRLGQVAVQGGDGHGWTTSRSTD